MAIGITANIALDISMTNRIDKCNFKNGFLKLRILDILFDFRLIKTNDFCELFIKIQYFIAD